MSERLAHAKINLALVVGPAGPSGKHEVTTVLQRVGLADRIQLEPSDSLRVEGFAQDSLVRGALEALARTANVEPRWAVRIEKQIPVAAGLGGGSSDAAAALALANETLERSLSPSALHELAAGLGADVPFFLAAGPQLGQGDGSTLSPVDLPQKHTVLLVVPEGAAKDSTAAVYRAFDERAGHEGYPERRAALLAALAAGDLAGLPGNDLAASPLTAELEALGAVRADASGAGPTVYGLFEDEATAAAAARHFEPRDWVWIGPQAW